MKKMSEAELEAAIRLANNTPITDESAELIDLVLKLAGILLDRDYPKSE